MKKVCMLVTLLIVALLCATVVACDNNDVPTPSTEITVTQNDVIIVFGRDVFPEGTTIEVDVISSNSQRAKEIENVLADKLYEKDKAVMFDVTAKSNSVAVQPSGQISITVNKPFADVADYVVYHIKSDNAVEELTPEINGEKLTVTVNGLSPFIFAKKHFHQYSDAYIYNENGHWYASTCGHEVKSGESVHHFGEWIIVEEAKEGVAGRKKQVCTDCGYEKIEEIPALVHTHIFADTYSYDDAKHWKDSTCGHDVKDAEGEHNIVEGECVVCGYTTPDPIDALIFSSYKSGAAYSVTGFRAELNIKNVVIPATYEGKPVVRIDNRVFKSAQIDTVVIPEGISEIGEDAFRDSTVKEITLPSTVTKIMDYAFNGCSRLKKLTAASNLTAAIFVGSNNNMGFMYNLEEASVSAELVTKLYTGGAYDASKLKMLTVNGGKIITGCKYDFTALETLIIAEGVEEIGNSAFQYTKIAELTIPASVKKIGSMAFMSTSMLRTVNFASGSQLTSIGTRAFNSSGVTSISLPNTLTTIGSNAFTSTGLVSVTIPGSVKVIDEYLFAKCKALTDVTLENGVEEIKLKAFSECTALKTAVLPNSITTMGDNVFEKCSSLTTVNVPQGINAIPQYTFTGCTSLMSIVIPANVKTIGLSAFSSCTSLASIAFSEGLESIARYAFSGCSSLVNLTLPSGLKIIDDYAFGSARITDVIIPLSVSYIGNGAFTSTATLYYEGESLPSGATFYCSVCLYSETQRYSGSYWHYVDGVPTKWN